MKLSKRFRIVAAVLCGGIVVASSACSVDSLQQATGPRNLAPGSLNASSGSDDSSGPVAGANRTFPDMSKDGTYVVTIDPTVDNVLLFGASKLDVPANSICALATTSYGPEFWNAPCQPEATSVQLTLTVKSGNGAAAVDFQPSLRFDPRNTVVLTLSAPQVSKQDAKDWQILYCPNAYSTSKGKGSGGVGGGRNGNKCVNESLNDHELRTFIDVDAKQLFRRIKHFSRYQVADGGYILGE